MSIPGLLITIAIVFLVILHLSAIGEIQDLTKRVEKLEEKPEETHP